MQRMREMQKCNLYDMLMICTGRGIGAKVYGMLMICKKETGHGIGKNHFMYIFHATHEGNAKVYDMLAGSEPKLSHLVSKSKAMTNRPSALLGS